MKKIYIMVFLLILIFAISFSSFGQTSSDFAKQIVNKLIESVLKLPNKSIAIMTFTNLSGEDTEEGKLLAQQMTSFLTSYNSVKVIERDQINKIVDEQKFSLSDMSEENEEQTVGKLLNVDAIIIGSIAHLDDNEEINVRIIDIKTGQIYKAVNVSKDINLRKEELKSLPAEQQKIITKEIETNRTLKKENPEQYNIKINYEQKLVDLRNNYPKKFNRITKIIRLMNRIKRDDPHTFIITTDTDRLAQLKKNNPAHFTKVNKIRQELTFVFSVLPAYKQILKKEREDLENQGPSQRDRRPDRLQPRDRRPNKPDNKQKQNQPRRKK